MSALEASRAATARAAETARLAASVAAQAQAELKAARAEESRILREQAKIELAEKIVQVRAKYDVTFGDDDEWIGVESDFRGESFGISIFRYNEFEASVNLTREHAINFSKFISDETR